MDDTGGTGLIEHRGRIGGENARRGEADAHDDEEGRPHPVLAPTPRQQEAEYEETRSSDKEGRHLQPAKLSDRQFADELEPWIVSLAHPLKEERCDEKRWSEDTDNPRHPVPYRFGFHGATLVMVDWEPVAIVRLVPELKHRRRYLLGSRVWDCRRGAFEHEQS